ncbi:uncharacterized protein [Hetaerina americana]|uniref:uncharacterized protein n=1 Tax=Hetaerina americana TaxID=62018 RepID=UPI003A7F3837
MGSKSKYLICRLCLSYGEVLVDICEGETEPGFEVKETVEDLLRLEVVPGGDLPWHVCLNCVDKLEEVSNFKFKCISSNSAFVQRFSKPRPSPQVPKAKTTAPCGTALSLAQRHMPVVDGAPSTIKVEDGEPLVSVCPLRQDGSGIRRGSSGSTAASPSSEGKAVYFKADDPRELVRSEMDDEPDECDLDSKEGVRTGRDFDQDTSDEGCNSSAAATCGETRNQCPLQPAATRLVVYAGGVEVRGDERALSDEDDQGQREFRLDKAGLPEDSASGRSLVDPLSDLGETPQERKRRMTRERQRRFRARQSPEIVWGAGANLVDPLSVVCETPLERKRRMARERQRRFRARQSSELGKRQETCNQSMVNSGDEGTVVTEKTEVDPKISYQVKL